MSGASERAPREQGARQAQEGKAHEKTRKVIGPQPIGGSDFSIYTCPSVLPILPFPLRRLDGLHNQPGTSVNAQSAIQEEVIETAIQPIVAEVVECIVSPRVIHAMQQTWEVVFIRMAQLHPRNLLCFVEQTRAHGEHWHGGVTRIVSCAR
jgi:hypothetical protein